MVVHTTVYLEYHTVVVLCFFFWKKKDTVVCLAGARSLLRPEKKVLVICLVGARSLLRPEKSSSRDFYAKLNVSNLNVTNLY